MTNRVAIVLLGILAVTMAAGISSEASVQSLKVEALKQYILEERMKENSQIFRLKQLIEFASGRTSDPTSSTEVFENLIFGQQNTFRAFNNFKIIADEVRHSAEKVEHLEVPEVPKIPEVPELTHIELPDFTEISEDIKNHVEQQDMLRVAEEVAQKEKVEKAMSAAVSKIEAPSLTTRSNSPIRVMAKKEASFVLTNSENLNLAGKIMNMDKLMRISGDISPIFHFKSEIDYMMKIIYKMINIEKSTSTEFFFTNNNEAIAYEVTGQQGVIGDVEATVISPKISLSDVPAGKQLSFFRSVDDVIFDRVQSFYDVKNERLIAHVSHALGVYTVALVTKNV